MRWKYLVMILILPITGRAFGQNSDNGTAPPLGDVAKQNKNHQDGAKSKAKHVFSDDDVPVRNSPIPAIALQGVENIEDVLNAIHEFRATHDAAETERVVHAWFDEQTEVLSGAIDANSKLAQHNQLRMESAQDRAPVVYDGDYSKLQQSQMTERWSQRVDARSNRDNMQTIMRIQQTFARVRIDAILNRGKTPYDWFKIRSANGVGTY
jgi:hypothetical protein